MIWYSSTTASKTNQKKKGTVNLDTQESWTKERERKTIISAMQENDLHFEDTTDKNQQTNVIQSSMITMWYFIWFAGLTYSLYSVLMNSTKEIKKKK